MDVKQKLLSYLWTLFVMYTTAIDASLEEVERHLEIGKQFLAKGQFADALTHYHAAVDLDPENYMTLYRRATVYLAMGKSKSALPDLDRVVELKPDFAGARLQRGNVLLKQGTLDPAAVDFEVVVAKEAGNAEAKQKLDALPQIRENVKLGNELFAQGDFMNAEFYLTKAIEVCPWDAALHRIRAQCYEATGQIQKAIADVRSQAKLEQDSTEAYYKLSWLHYQLADMQESLTEIRECLKLNPDHPKCFPHYKKLKKLTKQQETLNEHIQKQDWPACIEAATKVTATEPNVPALSHLMQQQLCKCHAKASHSAEAVRICSDVLSREEQPDAYCDRADAYILEERFDDAIADFQKAINMNEEFRRAHEGLKRAQKLLKQSKSRDYYKILGVRRNANKQQIMKAYRKLAQKWHPDNFHDETEKKAAEKKFIDIAAAKEVLTDVEMRSKFDNGEDPLDAEAQAQQHQHPFYGGGGFNPFGNGGPFHFKFNFG